MVSLLLKSREAMKLKFADGGDGTHLVYLNMSTVYKHMDDEAVKKSHRFVVDKIVTAIAAQAMDGELAFVEENEALKRKLHAFVARCCELMWNVLHHSLELCPLDELEAQSEVSMKLFDDAVHIRDGMSAEDSTRDIDYVVFPGLVDGDELKQKVWVCLNDTEDIE